MKCHARRTDLQLRTMRDIETIDSELPLVAALRHAARQRGGPMPSIAVADELLDKRREPIGLPRLTSCLGCYEMELTEATCVLIIPRLSMISQGPQPGISPSPVSQ